MERVNDVRVCPSCGSTKYTRVVMTYTPKGVRDPFLTRCRMCTNCRYRWSAIEINMDVYVNLKNIFDTNFVDNFEAFINSAYPDMSVGEMEAAEIERV